MSSIIQKCFKAGKARLKNKNSSLKALPLCSVKVLVVGSGGREHALACNLSSSPYVKHVLVAPGNAGTIGEKIGRLKDVDYESVKSIVDAATENSVDFVVIGHPIPLAGGVIDKLEEKGIIGYGPNAAAAALEGSKSFSKDFMQRHNIPTAHFKKFDDLEMARAYILDKGAPIVVKPDGLTRGLGVTVAQTVEEAIEALESLMNKGKFGKAGDSVLIEEFLTGEELSYFAVSDGSRALPFASAQDHKAAYDGDTGPNTGGMGAYSPALLCDKMLEKRIMSQVVVPTIKGMKSEGTEFKGTLFVGLMVHGDKTFSVLEYNVRFGDPECQVMCQRIKSDLFEVLYAASVGNLKGVKIKWSSNRSMLVIMASSGYPDLYETGHRISGIADAEKVATVKVYHDGTEEVNGEVLTNGGRVLGITATGNSVREAGNQVYEAVNQISWISPMWRSDIGWRAIERETEEDKRKLVAPNRLKNANTWDP